MPIILEHEWSLITLKHPDKVDSPLLKTLLDINTWIESLVRLSLLGITVFFRIGAQRGICRSLRKWTIHSLVTHIIWSYATIEGFQNILFLKSECCTCRLGDAWFTISSLIANSYNSNIRKSELAPLDEINTTNGVSGESFSKFLEVQEIKQREEGTYRLSQQSRMRETAASRIAHGARMTAGLFVCSEGHHANGEALAIIKRSREKKEQERLVRENKKKRERE